MSSVPSHDSLTLYANEQFHIARHRIHKKEFRMALEPLHNSLRTYVLIYGTSRIAASIHELLGHVYSVLNEPGKAKFHYEAVTRMSALLGSMDTSCSSCDDTKNDKKESNIQKSSSNINEHSDSMTKYRNDNEITSETKPRKRLSCSELESKAKEYLQDGCDFMDAENYEAALNPLRRALRSFVLVHGTCHYNVAIAHELLGVVYSAVGSEERAQIHYKAVVSITESLSPKSNDENKRERPKSRKRGSIKTAAA